jgi:sugar lactone lactonase YvrE
MATPATKTLLDGLMFPEGPRWHRGRLYFSDMQAHEVIAVDLQGRRETIANVPGRPSGLGVRPDGSWLAVSMHDRKLLRIAENSTETVADLSAFAGGHCNDMVVDAKGNAYVGNFGFDFENGEQPKVTGLALVTANGKARGVGGDLLFPNGMAITPDGKTLIVAESFAARLTAYEIASDGTLQNRRLWAQLQVPPDGICLDAEGCVWIANPMAPGGFFRVAEGGAIKAQLETPERVGLACMLGGPDRRTLFMLESVGSNPSKSARGHGRIRIATVDVPGAGWPSAEP